MSMLPLLISFVWGIKRKLPIFDPRVKTNKIPRFSGNYSQNRELRTASSLGAVMSNPTRIHTQTFLSLIGAFGSLVLYSEETLLM